jgi:hypothetical protein
MGAKAPGSAKRPEKYEEVRARFRDSLAQNKAETGT